jgi:hypothetical protein
MKVSTSRIYGKTRGLKPLVRTLLRAAHGIGSRARQLVLLCVLIIAVLPVWAFAADDDFGSAAIVGMGGAYAALPSEAATIWFNPALSSLSLTFARGCLATRDLYQLQALEERTGSLVFHIGRGLSLGGGFSQFGQSGFYTESRAVLTAAKNVGRNWAVGAGLHYDRVEFGDNVNAYAGTSLDLGAASRPAPHIVASAVVRRIELERLYETNNPPAMVELSAAWDGPSITLAGIWSKSSGGKSRFGIGQSLLVARDLPLGAGLVFVSGLRFDPIRYSLGARITGGGGSIDYVYQNHPDLGGTHAFGISFQISGP